MKNRFLITMVKILSSLTMVLISAGNLSGSEVDLVNIFKPHSMSDKRHIYNNAVLTASLNETVRTHGGFKINLNLPGAQRKRAILELISGRKINVHIVPTRLEWEEKTIPIRIPITKGLLGYRLFLINGEDADTFSKIRSIGQLKKLSAGLRLQWSTTTAMKALGFNVVTGSSYDGLFSMLVHDRFDYFPRGVNEIFHEFSAWSQKLPGLAIEKTRALYLPMPTYIFVSPKFPRLADRIETGLMKLVHNGKFDALFWRYHESNVTAANLKNRQIFYVENPYLSKQTPLENKALWFNPLTAKSNLE